MADLTFTMPDGSIAKLPDTLSPAEITDALNSHPATIAALQNERKTSITGDNLAREFGQGVLQGGGHMATAAVRAALPEFSNWMMRGPELKLAGEAQVPDQTVSTAPTYDERYAAELAKEKQGARTFEAAHPYVAGGTKIAGSVAGLAPLAPAIAGAAPAGVIGRTLYGGVAGLGLGGAQGGVSGYLEGEGAPLSESRLQSAKEGAASGALWGGIGGVAGVPLGIAARGAYTYAAPKVLNKLGSVFEGSGPTAAEIRGNLFPAEAPVTPKMVETAPYSDMGAGLAEARAAPEAAAPFRQRVAEKLKGTAENIEVNAAYARLADTLKQQGYTPAQAIAKIREIGPATMLADIGKRLRGEAELVVTKGHGGQDVMETALENRAAGTGERMGEAVNQYVGGAPNYFQAHEAATNTLKNTGDQAFAAARAAGYTPNAELQALNSTTAISKIRKTIEQWHVDHGVPIDPVDLDHQVKEAIQSTASKLYQQEGFNFAKPAGDVAQRYKAALHESMPLVKEADTSYKLHSDILDAMEKGQTFRARGLGERAQAVTPELIQREVAGQAPEVTQGLRTGIASDFNTALAQGEAGPHQLARDIVGNTIIQKRLAPVIGQENTQGLVNASQAERLYGKTHVNVMGGSPTGRRMTAAAEENIPGAEAAMRGDLGGAAMDVAKSFIKNVGTRPMTEGTREQLAKLLSQTNPAENQKILQRIAEMNQKRLAKALRGSASQSGIIGAGQVGGEQ
jgi:hypothetical protein